MEDKKEIYQLISQYKDGNIDEIDFSDNYYILYVMNKEYWSNNLILKKRELICFNKLSEITVKLDSFSEEKLDQVKTYEVKQDLKGLILQVDRKLSLYYLLYQFIICGTLTVPEFCDKYYLIYDLNDNTATRFTPDELVALNKLSEVAGRYSQYEEDHKACPKAYTSDKEVNEFAIMAYNKLE